VNLEYAQELHELIKVQGWASGLNYIRKLKNGKKKMAMPGEEADIRAIQAHFGSPTSHGGGVGAPSKNKRGRERSR
jgi:hypothetical protein